MKSFLIFLFILPGGWLVQSFVQTLSPPVYTELYRPQFHFSPPKNWMNDPNGLYYFQGEYHTFYQYNPYGPDWGHMSWGHAVSADLVHWKNLPLALADGPDGMIFSGSVVVDSFNRSTLGIYPGRPPILAIYTRFMPGKQDQCLAFSNDLGLRWTKYSKNPILDLNLKDFRDPKVFWYAPDQRWVMAVVVPMDQKVLFYTSKNLLSWTPTGQYKNEKTGGFWECPDLYPLPVLNQKEGEKKVRWVMHISLGHQDNSPEKKIPMVYFVGDFNGKTFINDDPLGIPIPFDLGKDFYAGVTFTGVPDGLGGLSRPEGVRDSVSLVSGSGVLSRPKGVRDSVSLASGSGGLGRPKDGTGDRKDGIGGVSLASGSGGLSRPKGGTGDRKDGLGGVSLASGSGGLSRPKGVRDSVSRPKGGTGGGNPPSRRILIGWMSNWTYASHVPTQGWRGTQSFPRELNLIRREGKLIVVQRPIRELSTHRVLIFEANGIDLSAANERMAAAKIKGKNLQIEMTIDPLRSRSVTLAVRKGGDQETLIRYDHPTQILSLDRLHSGNTSFSPSFPSVDSTPLGGKNPILTLNLLIDDGSVELFAQGGEKVFTDLIFPSPTSTGLELRSDGGPARVEHLRIYSIPGIWPDGSK